MVTSNAQPRAWCYHLEGMPRFLARLVLPWLTVASLLCPLSPATSSEDRAHARHPALSAGLSPQSGLAVCRSGSSSHPDTVPQVLAVLPESARPRPMAVLVVAAAVDSAMVALLELSRPQRGPPSSS